MAKKWIQSAIKNKGALRRSLKKKKGKKLTLKDLAKARKSKNVTTRRRAALAMTLRKISRKNKKRR